jgi:diguanylate cyclase (GGDEF)-like protein
LPGGNAPISTERPPSATAGDAIRFVARLLASGNGGPAALEQALTRELRAFTGAEHALLLRVDESAGTATPAAADPDPGRGSAEVVGGAEPGGPASAQPAANPIPLDHSPQLADALTAELAIRLDGSPAAKLGTALGLDGSTSAALLLPMRAPDTYVLALTGSRVRALSVEEVESAAALLAVAGTAVAQASLLEQGARDAERHSALARAAKALNESLDLSRVLPRICQEAAAILDADAVAVYRGSGSRGLVLEAEHPGGAGAEADVAVAAEALELGRPVVAREPGGGDICSALAVPMRWDGEARGVLWVGFRRAAKARAEQDLTLLESFAELAAVACRNASVHAGLAEAARTDGLTGCLNHAALHETLRREMQRSRRTGRRLSIVLVDLDNFKQVNEQHGHLVGDEVLRRVGRALREAVRPYDFVARYGGDEFAIVAVDAHESRAAEIGERSIARLRSALDEIMGEEAGTYATAGVAEWDGVAPPNEIVREADRALLFGKQQGIRGQAVVASDVAPGFSLGRAFADDQPQPRSAATEGWPSAVREETEPLRKRARQLALANALAARVASLNRVESIAAAVVDELERGFGYSSCALVLPAGDGTLEAVGSSGRRRPWRELRASDAVERCLVDRRPVRLDEPPSTIRRLARSGQAGSELAVPILVDSHLWGALDIQEQATAAFEEADVRLLEAVAESVGAAVSAAARYEQLERAYLATAEALGSALESKDAHTAEHARSIVRNAEAVGTRLGMSADELRDLRYAAAFHDIGKIAVPERILNKPGPLTESERLEVERHVEIGAQILSQVDFLEGVLPLVRHCHEHWDGGGYPDGLAGDRIPLGARVILVCDAHDAMTADRPYRPALAPDRAYEEIREAAGRQFDTRVATAFLDAVGKHASSGL